MDLGNLAENAAYLGGGAGSVLAGTRAYFSRVFARIDRVEARMADLEEKRLARVEGEVAALREDGCKAGAVVHAKMETLIAQSNEMLGGVHHLQRLSAAQTEKLDLIDRSASKLWEKFDDHRQHHPGKTAGG
jgi:hypothetical protein